MNEFLTQFGIEWKMLLSQAVAFLLLFFLLKKFAYKPLLEILRKRREKIDQGLQDAKVAKEKLAGIEEIADQELKKAERKGVVLLKEMEIRVKKEEAEKLVLVRKKEEEILRKADVLAIAKQQEAEKKIQQEAISLVKRIIVKTVELDPNSVDDALIKQASANL